MDQFDIAARYPNLLPSEQIEEAIAEAFAEAITTRKAPSGALIVRGALNKVVRLLRAIRNAFNGDGFNTVEDIFGKVNHLTERSVIDPAMYYECPYTDLSDQGISGVFPEADVQRIVSLVRDITLSAVA